MSTETTEPTLSPSLADTDGPAPCPARFNMARHVLAPARQKPDDVALRVLADGAGGVLEEWRYADMDRAIRGTAAGLQAAGLAPGDRVALRLGNTSTFPILFFATIAAGGVAVPTAAGLTARELGPLLARIAPRFLAIGEGLDTGLAEAVPAGVTCLPTEALAELAQHAPGPIAETGAEDPAFLIFTSGTSGSPRGVLHAQRSAWARRMMWDGWYGLGPEDRVLHAGAFNWTYTLGAGLTDPWAAGARALVYAGPRDPGVWRQLIAAERATIFAAVPGVYRKALKAAEGDEVGLARDLASLRHGLTAGERLSPVLGDAWQAKTGKRLHEALGMSECSTFISGSPARPAPRDTAGFPQPGRRVAILPEGRRENLRDPGAHATPVPRGTPGLLGVSRRDPGLMLGYWQDPEATAAAFCGEWFLTGDRAVMTPEGAIRHLGRADDIMNALGYRVGPQEVEDALAGHPEMTELAVAELPMRADLSLVAAFYVPRDPLASAPGLETDALDRFAAERLAPYKRPRLWIPVASLPRTANGKLLRRQLVAEHRRDHEAALDTSASVKPL